MKEREKARKEEDEDEEEEHPELRRLLPHLRNMENRNYKPGTYSKTNSKGAGNAREYAFLFS